MERNPCLSSDIHVHREGDNQKYREMVHINNIRYLQQVHITLIFPYILCANVCKNNEILAECVIVEDI